MFTPMASLTQAAQQRDDEIAANAEIFDVFIFVPIPSAQDNQGMP